MAQLVIRELHPGLVLDMNIIVPHDGPGHEQVSLRNHKAARHYAYATFKRTHMDVELKEAYILPLQKGFGKGDGRGVVAA